MPDKIDQAVDAVAAADVTVEMMSIPVGLSSTGRPAVVQIPADATDAELVDLAGWLLTVVRAHIRENARPRSRLVVPRRLPT